MKIDIIAIGNMKQGGFTDLCKSYQKRLGWKVNVIELVPKKALSGAALKAHEADLILAKRNNKPLIALDERGKTITSPDFAKTLGQLRDLHGGCQIVIGGADGLDASIRKQAQYLISFGKQTWPHQLVRVMLIEQLYRSEMILAGHPYHKV